MCIHQPTCSPRDATVTIGVALYVPYLVHFSQKHSGVFGIKLNVNVAFSPTATCSLESDKLNENTNLHVLLVMLL